MTDCTCTHYPDMHRRRHGDTDWHCRACRVCGRSWPGHSDTTVGSLLTRPDEKHPFELCNCKGRNT